MKHLPRRAGKKMNPRMIYMAQDMNLSALFHFNMCSVAYSLRIIVLERQIIAPNHKVEKKECWKKRKFTFFL